VVHFIHETWHAVSRVKVGVKHTHTSPRLEIEEVDGQRLAKGDIITEAAEAYDNTKDKGLKEFLGYYIRQWAVLPGDANHTNRIKEETTAQLWALYHTNNKLMQQELPIAHQFFKELTDDLRKISDAGTIRDQANAVSKAVQHHLQGVPVEEGSGRAGERGRGDPSYDESSSDRETDSGDRPVRGEGQAQGDERLAKAEKLRQYLTDAERIKTDRKSTAKGFVDKYLEMPSVAERAAIAWAGKAKRGWYRSAARALHHVFGNDAPRFAVLLAASSPQVTVEKNLHFALKMWTAWNNAGRPQSHSKITKLGYEAAEGVLGYIPSYHNNVIRALTHPDPTAEYLSGPKVDSFWRNLLGNVEEVTNDAWMTAWAGVSSSFVAGDSKSLDEVITEAGKRPGYLALNAHTRAAAKLLTKLTGETWTPAEVQETVWSWTKALYEMANVGLSAHDIIKSRGLTDAIIGSVPDFGTLLKGGEYGAILNKGGYRAGLQRLADADRENSGATEAEQRDAGKTAPFAEKAQLKYELKSAARLDALRQKRADAENFNETGYIAKEGEAVYDDFREDPETALKKPGWSIVTASKDGNGTLADEVRNDDLEAYLIKQKIEHHEVAGYYEGIDQGRNFLIFTDDKTAMKIGKKYKQDSIRTNKGLEYTDGHVQKSVHEKSVFGDEAKKLPYYSVLPDGTAFAMGLEETTETDASESGLKKEAEPTVDKQAKVKLQVIESETGRKVNVEMEAGEVLAILDQDIEKTRNLLQCLSL
jgi:hypothetical protein